VFSKKSLSFLAMDWMQLCHESLLRMDSYVLTSDTGFEKFYLGIDPIILRIWTSIGCSKKFNISTD